MREENQWKTLEANTRIEGKSSLLNAVITLVVMGVLALVAYLFKVKKDEAVQGGMQAGPRQEEVQKKSRLASLGLGNKGEEAQAGNQRSAVAAPLKQKEVDFSKVDYWVLPRCELVENRSNDADSFRLRYDGQEHVFELYFVDAPETFAMDRQQVTAQGRHFGHLSDEVVVQVGQRAKALVLDTLRSKPFKVFTRWEKSPHSRRYLAFVLLENQSGDDVFLSQLIMAKGLGRLAGVEAPLPNGVTSADQYRKMLHSYERHAQQARVGAWKEAKQTVMTAKREG